LRFERWYWLPLFLGISLGIHIGVVLLTRGAGGTGSAANVSEIEISLVPYRETVAQGLPDPNRGRRARPAQAAAIPEPFSPPTWQRRPTETPPPEMGIRTQQPARAIAPTGATTPWAGAFSGSRGSGQSGFVGMSTPPRVLRVSAGDAPVHQVPIGSPESASGLGDANGRRNTLTVRARPQTQTNPPPVYPEEARAQHQEGTVYLRVAVSADGRAENVELLLSSGFALLDEAALTAVRDWAFDPARNESGPVSSHITVPVRFTLN
jgi:TonB family protein